MNGQTVIDFNVTTGTSKETWLPIEGYEGHYEVSTYGQIKSIVRYVERSRPNRKSHLLKCGTGNAVFQEDAGNGYLKVSLSKDGKRKKHWVHRIVASTFIPNPLNKREVNHIDSNPKNNHVSNLEWATPSENMKHCFRVGRSNVLQIIKTGTDSFNATPVRQLTIDGKVVAEWGCIVHASQAIGIRAGNISAAINGRQKTSGGFKWERVSKSS